MAIKYFTGFESEQAILEDDGLTFSNTPTLTTAQRHRTLSDRGGSQSVLMNNAADKIIIPAFTVADNEEIGIAFRYSSPGGTAGYITFRNESGGANLTLTISDDNFMRWCRGNQNGTIFATSGGVLAPDTWYWAKIILTVKDVGRAQVFLNGSTTAFLDTGAGVDCRATSSDYFESVLLSGNSGNFWFDDYVQAGAGDLPDRELFIQEIRPEADASPTDGIPSSGSDNFAMVNDATLNTTTYNEITVSGDEDRFTFGSLGFTPLEVIAIRTMSDMTAEGSLTDGRGVVSTDGGDLYGTNRAIATGGQYAIVGDIFPLDPDGNAWTGDSVDGIVAGYQVN